MPFARSKTPFAAIGRGEIVVVVDDEDRENEGDLIMAAEFVTADKIAFFLHHTSGYILCADHQRARPRARAERNGRSEHGEPAHGISRVGRLHPRHVDRHLGVDRAATISALVDPATRQTTCPAGSHPSAGGPRRRRA